MTASVSSHRGQFVKASKQFIQRHDQLLGRTLRCQAGEALNVCKQYTAGEVVVVMVGGREGGLDRGRGERW